MHRTRLLVAVFALPLLYVWIKYLPPVAFLPLALGVILLGQYEFYRLYHPRGQWGWILTGLLSGAATAIYFYADGAFGAREFIAALTAAALLYQLATRREMAGGLADAAVGLLGVLYVGWFLGHLILLRNMPDGGNLVLFLLLVTWAGDTGAYYAGKSLGRYQLAPKISPNKTIEGAAGGLAACLLAAGAGRLWLIPGLSAQDVIILGLLLGSLGLLGDLTESLFKRGTGVKDSGGFIPGHGGVLDKVDSLIFTAPAFYYYLVWFMPAGSAISIRV